jgi:hypothetical protein
VKQRVNVITVGVADLALARHWQLTSDGGVRLN